MWLASRRVEAFEARRGFRGVSRLALTPVAHRVASLVAYSVEAASRLSRLVVEASVEAASRFCVEASRPGLKATSTSSC